MFENKNELEAREEILSFVDEYCKKYHAKKDRKSTRLNSSHSTSSRMPSSA